MATKKKGSANADEEIEATENSEEPITKVVRGKYALNRAIGPKQRYTCNKTGISKLMKDFTEDDFKRMFEAKNPNVTQS